MMIERIIIAGSGGQGVMLLGKVLAEAAMIEGKEVSWLPAYGAEVRGGTAYCMVVISDQEIASPYVERADTLIAMNSPSLDKFSPRMAKKGLLIINSSLAAKEIKTPASVFKHPFTDTAAGLGNIKIANMLALGYFIARKKILRLESAARAIERIAPPDKKSLIRINQEALKKGAALAGG